MVFYGEHIATWNRPDALGDSVLTLCPPPPPQSSQGGGHRTLLYGHAILLRHTHSGMVSARVRGRGQGQGTPGLPEEADSPVQP